MASPECERVRVFVFPYQPSRFASETATKEEESRSAWLPGPCSQDLVLAGLKPPDGARAVCAFFLNFFSAF